MEFESAVQQATARASRENEVRAVYPTWYCDTATEKIRVWNTGPIDSPLIHEDRPYFLILPHRRRHDD